MAHVPHDLGRIGVRNLVRAGIPEVVAMVISGHRTRWVFESCDIESDRNLQEAARRLENHIGDVKKVELQQGLGTLLGTPGKTRWTMRRR